MNSTTVMQVIWHQTPEACQHAMWSPIAEADGLSAEELMRCELGGFDENGNDVAPITMEQACDAIWEAGCWGFVDTNTNIIHAWAAADTDPAMVVHMLAHEIGHATGSPFEDQHAEEMRAETFGHVAAQAVRLYSERHGTTNEVERLRSLVVELESSLSEYEGIEAYTKVLEHIVEKTKHANAFQHKETGEVRLVLTGEAVSDWDAWDDVVVLPVETSSGGLAMKCDGSEDGGFDESNGHPDMTLTERLRAAIQMTDDADNKAAQELWERGEQMGRAGDPCPVENESLAHGWRFGNARRRIYAGEAIGFVSNGTKCDACGEQNWGHRLGCRCNKAPFTQTVRYGVLVNDGLAPGECAKFMTIDELRALKKPVIDSVTGVEIDIQA